jgi:hypothetical protein
MLLMLHLISRTLRFSLLHRFHSPSSPAESSNFQTEFTLVSDITLTKTYPFSPISHPSPPDHGVGHGLITMLGLLCVVETGTDLF